MLATQLSAIEQRLIAQAKVQDHAGHIVSCRCGAWFCGWIPRYTRNDLRCPVFTLPDA